MNTPVDRETQAFREAFAVITDRAPNPPEFEELAALHTASRERSGSPMLRARGLVQVAAAMAAAAVLVLPVVTGSRSALAAITEARSAFQQITAFRATLVGRQAGPVVAAEVPSRGGEDRVFRHDLWFAGVDLWRVDIVEDSDPELSGGSGSLTLWDGRKLVTYRAMENTYSVGDRQEAGFGPMHLLDPNNALLPVFADGRMPPDDYFRDECIVGGEERIAGRITRRLDCEDRQIGIWLDIETGLVLKSKSALAEHEVTSIELEPPFDDTTFIFTPPAGATMATDLDDHPESLVSLTIGEVAPSWHAPLVGGGTMHLLDLRGKPALVLLWADWCEPCIEEALPLLDEIDARMDDDVTFVAVDIDGVAESAVAIVAQEAYEFPVVVDGSCSTCTEPGVAEAWGVEAVPIWVVLDSDGLVVDVLGAGTGGADGIIALLRGLRTE